jgi:hypothetical protein
MVMSQPSLKTLRRFAPAEALFQQTSRSHCMQDNLKAILAQSEL